MKVMVYCFIEETRSLLEKETRKYFLRVLFENFRVGEKVFGRHIVGWELNTHGSLKQSSLLKEGKGHWRQIVPDRSQY